jgi:hypothetical protein
MRHGAWGRGVPGLAGTVTRDRASYHRALGPMRGLNPLLGERPRVDTSTADTEVQNFWAIERSSQVPSHGPCQRPFINLTCTPQLFVWLGMDVWRVSPSRALNPGLGTPPLPLFLPVRGSELRAAMPAPIGSVLLWPFISVPPTPEIHIARRGARSAPTPRPQIPRYCEPPFARGPTAPSQPVSQAVSTAIRRASRLCAYDNAHSVEYCHLNAPRGTATACPPSPCRTNPQNLDPDPPCCEHG